MTPKYNEEKTVEIEDYDRIDFDEKLTIEYKGNRYNILSFKYRDVQFLYAPISLAEQINKEQNFESEILDEVTYFIYPKQMDEMYELLRKTPSWSEFWTFCYYNCIYANSVDYHFMETELEFEEKEYPVAIMEVSYHCLKYIYTTKKAKNDKDFVKYLKDEWDCFDVCDVSKKDLEKIQDFLDDGKLYQEFEQFCNENNIKNIVPKQNFIEDDKGFKFDTYEYRKAQERKNLPEGYSEADEETLEISEEEYNRLSQTLDCFLSKKNPRWCKDGVVEEKFAEFCENLNSTSICGYVYRDIKRFEDEIKNYEFCKNNNALIYEQFRNVSKFQNILQDAINCSNNVYTDLLNIKDFSTPIMNEESEDDFFYEYNELMETKYPTKETQIEDYTLQNRYKIENTGKSVFERVSFSSLENVLDAIYVTDIKPPFKVIDLETNEDVTEKIMEIAEAQDYMFIDTEEIIKKLPDSFEEINRDSFKLKYLDKKDDKQIKFLNRVNFKHIIGFKDLWQNNCVPFGYKRNFVLFVDLNQPDNPVYRIDYRRISDFETRKLLNESFKDYISYIPNDWSN